MRHSGCAGFGPLRSTASNLSSGYLSFSSFMASFNQAGGSYITRSDDAFITVVHFLLTLAGRFAPLRGPPEWGAAEGRMVGESPGVSWMPSDDSLWLGAMVGADGVE